MAIDHFIGPGSNEAHLSNHAYHGSRAHGAIISDQGASGIFSPDGNLHCLGTPFCYGLDLTFGAGHFRNFG